MTSVYKFDNYSTYKISSSVLYDTGTIKGTTRVLTDPFIPYYYQKYNGIAVPILNKIDIISNEDCSYTGKIDIKHLLNTVDNFTFEDKLYLHPNCSIPRAKVTQKYTRVIKPEKADICVVPKLERTLNTKNISIFINRNKYKLFILTNYSYWNNNKLSTYASDICSKFPLESSILDINPCLKNSFIKNSNSYNCSDSSSYTQPEEWKDFLESTLLYYGPVVYLNNKETWIADLLYNKLHDVITEDRILDTLGDSTNKFTKEVYDSFKEMLNSSDSSVIALGLKAIAEMDYKTYHNTVVHLLYSNSKWFYNGVKQNSSSSVKYMLNYLGLWRSVLDKYTRTITQEDFDLMQEVAVSTFKRKVEDLKKSFNLDFPFTNLELSYQFKISPRLETIEPALKVEEDEDID